MLKGKKIVLAISGSIAAYKSALLTRLLVKEGATVRIVMSTAALDFITPLTLATLSKHPVAHRYFDPTSGAWENHVEIGLWADLMVVAPATANTIAKCAQGLCDNLLTAVYLSAKCPVYFAPAMDLDMYKHPSTQENLKKLLSYGNHIIPAGTGELASGLHGEGRMAEPEEIVSFLENSFQSSADLKGKKVLITAGPTYEALDPVRFIGNHSSGKMGFALARAFAQRGAEVHLVAGPSHIALSSSSHIHRYDVQSAQEMYEQAAQLHSQMDICVFAAAVADYRPAEVAKEKIKKTADATDMQLTLVKNTDIAATLGKQKKKNQIHVGFALETENEEQNAQDKLKRKNFDLIVLNSLREAGAGFKHDTNKVNLYFSDNKSRTLGLDTKENIAHEIVEAIIHI